MSEYKSPDFPGQEEWRNLRNKYGTEEATKIVVRKLRAFADVIEQSGWPQIFGCHIETEKDGFQDLMETIEVTVSHPWPG